MASIFFVIFRSAFRTGLTAFFVACLTVSHPAIADQSLPPQVILHTRSGDHSFTVEVARTPAERAEGLMYRRTLAADRGMLFDFGSDVGVSMWMKNTFIPLDMIFIDAEGKVANVARDTVPESTAAIPAARPVRYVLEVNAGTARRIGLQSGDRVTLE